MAYKYRFLHTSNVLLALDLLSNHFSNIKSSTLPLPSPYIYIYRASTSGKKKIETKIWLNEMSYEHVYNY